MFDSLRTRRQTHRSRLEAEPLEDRTTPTVSVISSNFNGTAIPAGDTIWFNSVMKVSGLGTAPVTVFVKAASVDFTDKLGNNYHVPMPDAVITFNPSAASAATAFDTAANAWNTTVPSGLGGNTFLDGVALPLPGGLPGGTNPVNFTADFTTDTPGIKINWQWAAAAYSQFGTDPAGLGVKPVDSNSASVYHNSDHAGTPENFKTFVLGGARGGGGSNFTGSYSATKAVFPELAPPPVQGPPEISGHVFGGITGTTPLSGVTLTLTGLDANNNVVTLTATTDTSGFYSFGSLGDLPPGTYAITETVPLGYDHANPSVGTVGGSADGVVGTNAIGSIVLNPGNVGVNYDFVNVLAG
jgi:hypothetical protein